MTAFDDWLRRARELRLDRSGGATKPYKPAMLLAAILLVRKGRFADNLLTLAELSPVFDQVLKLVAPACDGPSDRKLPFRHLESDGIWRLVARAGEEQQQAAMLALAARAREVLRHTTGVQFEPEVFARLRDSEVDALAAALAVFDAYQGVFRSWGLAEPRHARKEIAGWLSSNSTGPAEPPATRTLGERMVEEWIEQHWQQTPFALRGLALVGRQLMTPLNTIDLLAHDPRGIWWVIEIKRRNSSDAVVGQLSRYRGWIASSKQVPNERACGIVLTDSVSEHLRQAMKMQHGAELWRYDDAMQFELLPG